MSDRVVLLNRDSDDHAQEIIAAFAQRTGLESQPIEGGTAFLIGAHDHGVEIVQTLNEIDPQWSEHLYLGDPGAEPNQS